MRDGEQVEHTQVGGDFQANQVAVVVQRHTLSGGTDRQCELAAFHFGEINKHARNGIFAHHRAIELKLDILTIKREVGVSADQAGLVGAGIKTVEINPRHRQARGCTRLDHRQNKV